MNSTEHTFGARVTIACERRQWTQKKLAEELKILQSKVSDWLDDDKARKPSFDETVRMAQTLGVRPAWLAFDDEFEPMDDEERELIEDYRKLNEAERAALRQTFRAIAQDRTERLKKPGARTKRASPSTLLAEFADEPVLLKEVHAALAELLEHESVLPVGSKAERAVERASTLLDRLAVALRSKSQSDLLPASAASLQVASPAPAKQPQDRKKSHHS